MTWFTIQGTKTCMHPTPACGGPAPTAALLTPSPSTTSDPPRRGRCTTSYTTEKRENAAALLHCCFSGLVVHGGVSHAVVQGDGIMTFTWGVWDFFGAPLNHWERARYTFKT